MNEEMLITIVVSVIAAMTSTKAWDYWQKKLQLKAEQQKAALQDDNLLRDDLRKEVNYLRKALSEAQITIIELSTKLAEMTTRVEYLETEKQLKGAS
jgi:septal ring factor EnvC (AmiA/AmiB activator)